MFVEKESPERLEKVKEVQRRLVLDMLRERGSVTNLEFVRAKILRFSARIEELRKEGHLIDTINEGNGVFRYVYRGFEPRRISEECSLLIMRDGQTRAKKSWTGDVEIASRRLELEREPFDTFVFVRNRSRPLRKPFLLVFMVKEGRFFVEKMPDNGWNRRKINELIKQYDFVVVRRVESEEAGADKSEILQADACR